MSTFLQTTDINLLIAVEVVEFLFYSIKESLEKMRNEEYEFQNIYEKKLLNNILIPIF